jgi:enoyl-CoA hydratase/carnithine racemase
MGAPRGSQGLVSREEKETECPRPVFDSLLFDVEDGIATITLHRPEKLNAYNTHMMEELVQAFDITDADDAVKAVIVTGSGRAFCAGADLSAGVDTFKKEAPGPGEEVPRDTAGQLTLRIFDSLKPVIGACNGAAVGVGATMQLAMDIRIASTTARYGFIFSRRGITVEGASTWFLPRIVGPSTALEWAMSGRIFPAQEALERGLIKSIHEPKDLLPAARALARDMVDNSAPVSVALTRQMIWRMMGASHPMAAHLFESRALYARSLQDDRNEGINSFIEKRDANFPDTVTADLPKIWSGWHKPGYGDS